MSGEEIRLSVLVILAVVGVPLLGLYGLVYLISRAWHAGRRQ